MSKQTVIVSVLADTKKFGQSMGSAGNGVKGFTRMLAPVAGAIAAAFSVKALTDFTTRAVKLASELEQSVGGVEAVFKDSADAIGEYSRRAAQDIGLTKTAYNTNATLIGTFLKAAGTPMERLAEQTHNLVVRGADLAATFGGPVEEAVNAMGSALRGEFLPLRRYGVSLMQAEINAKALAMTGKTVAASLTLQEKAAATQTLIFEKSADAAGQFAREASTFAGQQERMKAALENTATRVGEFLLPVFTRFTSFVNESVLPEFEKLVEVVGPKIEAALAQAEPHLRRFVEDVFPALTDATVWAIEKAEEWAKFWYEVGVNLEKSGVLKWLDDATGKWYDFWHAVGYGAGEFFRSDNIPVGGITQKLRDAQAQLKDTSGAVADFSATSTVELQSWSSMSRRILDETASDFANVKPKVKDAFKDSITWLRPAGEQMSNGLVTGIESVPVSSRLRALVNRAVNDVKRDLGIHSPSRVFAGIGKDLVRGLEVGLAAPNRLDRVMTNLSGQVVDGFDATLNAPHGRGGAGGGNTYIVNLQTLAPTAEAGRMVRKALDDFERFGGGG